MIGDTLKAVFQELIGMGVLWGVKAVFDGVMDLKLEDPTMKVLFLVYLQYDRNVYPIPFRQRYLSESYPAHDLRKDYPIHFPFLGKTFLSHWKENRKLLEEPIWVKFVDLSSRLPRYYGYSPSWEEVERRIERAKDHVRKGLEKEGYDPSKVLLVDYYGKIEENIGEFIALMFFRSRGYLTLNFGPYTGVRAPDVTCWKTPLLSRLREEGLVEHGTTLYELQMLRILKRVESNRTEDGRGETVVIEVESESSRWGSGIMQLLGKSYTGYGGYVQGYDEGYIVCPFSRKSDDRIGVLSFDEKGIFFQECPKSWTDEERRRVRQKEIDDLIKTTLIANLTLNETLELVHPRPTTYFQLLSELINLESETLLDKLKAIIF